MNLPASGDECNYYLVIQIRGQPLKATWIKRHSYCSPANAASDVNALMMRTPPRRWILLWFDDQSVNTHIFSFLCHWSVSFATPPPDADHPPVTRRSRRMMLLHEMTCQEMEVSFFSIRTHKSASLYTTTFSGMPFRGCTRYNRMYLEVLTIIARTCCVRMCDPVYDHPHFNKSLNRTRVSFWTLFDHELKIKKAVYRRSENRLLFVCESFDEFNTKYGPGF